MFVLPVNFTCPLIKLAVKVGLGSAATKNTGGANGDVLTVGDFEVGSDGVFTPVNAKAAFISTGDSTVP